MATKTTGAEMKAFIQSDWGDGVYMTGYAIDVNGERFDEFGESFEEEDLNPTDKVVIVAGSVVNDESDSEVSLQTFFKRWKKIQSTAYLSVECSKEKLEAVMAAIVAAGGKVK